MRRCGRHQRDDATTLTTARALLIFVAFTAQSPVSLTPPLERAIDTVDRDQIMGAGKDSRR
jgi:hypothetical protein